MPTLKHFSRFLLFATLLFSLSLSITSCSKSDDGDEQEATGPSTQSVSLSVSELDASSGSGKIYYTGAVSTAWSAQIISEDDFVSFSSQQSVAEKNGTVVSSGQNTLFFYYEQNETGFDRSATITFCFDKSEPVTLSLSQLSVESTDSPYKSADGSPRWSEIPTKVDNDTYIYVTHSVELNGSQVRNFSLCFDVDNHAAAWVAFPYHKVYDGDVGRNERWTYDPKIAEKYQPNLSNSYSGSYDRGHQMASADRQATVAMNQQTFYYSNMTPQLGTLNQQTWANFEIAVRNQVCSDTLFVVTGADFTTTIGTTTDRDGMVCPLPGAYYKVMLRTRTGTTGKAVSDCSASELQAIGFWFEHRAYDNIPSPVTVKEIEEKTGFTFFPNIPDEVKSKYTSTDWSF